MFRALARIYRYRCMAALLALHGSRAGPDFAATQLETRLAQDDGVLGWLPSFATGL